MSFDVFISYSAKDKPTADAACAKLEASGVRCWIAPRDIRPSATWAGAIVKALEQCRAMVLIFSSHANESSQIRREVAQAISNNVPIVPLRIEETKPTEDLAYYVGAVHWLDALSPPLEKHLEYLTAVVKSLLSVPSEKVGSAEDSAATHRSSSAPGRPALLSPSDIAREPPVRPADEPAHVAAVSAPAKTAKRAWPSRRALLIGGALAAVAVGGVARVLRMRPAGVSSSSLKRILLRGYIEGKPFTVELSRIAADEWSWTENDVKFRFRSTMESSYQIILYDSGRNIYHLLDLSSRLTFWRIGTSEAWKNHYEIVGME
jgi:hypothetical protein